MFIKVKARNAKQVCYCFSYTLTSHNFSSIASLLNMVGGDNGCGINLSNSNSHSKHDEKGHVPCPCQSCNENKTPTAEEKAEKVTFDLLSNGDGLTLGDHQVDLLTSTFSASPSVTSSTVATTSTTDEEMIEKDSEMLFENGKMVETVTNISFENQNPEEMEESKMSPNEDSKWKLKQVSVSSSLSCLKVN